MSNRRQWSDYEVKLLKRYYAKEGPTFIGRELNLNTSTVVNEAIRRGLVPRASIGGWSKGSLAKFIEIYPYTTNRAIFLAFNGKKTIAQICLLATKLSLKKTYKW